MPIGSTAGRTARPLRPLPDRRGDLGRPVLGGEGRQVARLPEPLSDWVLGRARQRAPGRPQIADRDRVIYELHLRGFTRHSSSGVAHPGTYLGLIEKIPYLQSLGITTVELMPLLEFDETENFRRNPVTAERLLNFWGYSPVSFFAPKAAYAADPAPGAAQAELVAMVDALHAAGLEVLVDVVYNHTAEGGGGASDPLHSFRGLAEETTTCAIRRPAGRSTSPAAATRSTRTIRWSAG